MFDEAQRRTRRWQMRRLERQERRRSRAVAPPTPQLLAAVSVVDGYCAILGPVSNDDDPAPAPRRDGRPLALVRG